MNRVLSIATAFFLASTIFSACNNIKPEPADTEAQSRPVVDETPEYFNLRPKLEHEYGYTHAVKIGNDLKIPEQ